MVLEPATEVRELNRADRPGHAAVFLGMQPLLPRIHQHAVAVNVATIVVFRRKAIVRLKAEATGGSIVERDAVRPHALVALTLLLRVVPPMDGVPVEIDADVVLERGPDRRP